MRLLSIFTHDHIHNSNTYWCCENRSQCSRRLIQKGDQILVVTAKHNHEPNEQMIRQKLYVKELILENAMPIRELVHRYTDELDSVRVLPQFNQIKNALYPIKKLNYRPSKVFALKVTKFIKSDHKLLNEFLFQGKL